jgi:hypothetical protein
MIAVDPHEVLSNRGERLFWSIGGSVAVAVVGGLVLDEIASLDRLSWCLFLVGVVVLALMVGWIRGRVGGRRVTARGGRRKIWKDVEGGARGVNGTARGGGKGLHRAPITLRSVIVLGAACGMLVAAVALSQQSVTANNPKFIELWMLPRPLAAGARARSVELGVQNLEGRSVGVVVRLSEGKGRLVERWIVELAVGGTWSKSVAREGTSTLTATVSYASDPGEVVRYVDLKGPVSEGRG